MQWRWEPVVTTSDLGAHGGRELAQTKPAGVPESKVHYPDCLVVSC